MFSSREFSRLCVFAVVLLQAFGGLAYARGGGNNESEGARAERHQGTVAVNLGRYDEAVDHFSKAYTISQDPDLLFSLAQAYRLADKPEKALAAYSAFLRAAETSPKLRPQIERAANEIESITSYLLHSRPADRPLAPAQTVEPAHREKPAAEVAIAPPPLKEKSPPKELDPESDEGKAPVLLPKPASASAPALTFVAQEKPAPASPPVYKRWWFWTSVAGALAIGGVATWYYTRPTNQTPPSTYGSVRVLP